MLDVLYRNGRFWTGDPERPTATAVGVIGGMIVGLDHDVLGLKSARVHDLGGAPVVPGFHDAHFHLSAVGQHLRRCDVSPASVSTLDDLYAALGRFADALAPGAWVVAEGYEDDKLGAMPDRHSLDRVTGGRPAWVVHASHHAGVANTEALRRMGFTDLREVPDVVHGVVQRDHDGAATGYFAEAATALVNVVLRPEPTDEFVAAIAAGSAHALSMGLTSVTEPGISGMLTGNGPHDLADFQRARDLGLLGVRTTVMPEVAALHALDISLGTSADDLGLDLGLRTGLGDDRLRVGGVKMFADGAFTARTAAVHHCYLESVGGGDGVLLTDPDTLRANIVAAHRAGWQVCTHAIGDRGVDRVLDALEEAQSRHPRTDSRHRIEHCGLVSQTQVKRIVALGVIPVPQGRFISEFGDNYVRVLGDERAERVFAQASFLRAGIELPGSSDCPVVGGEPLKGLQALVTRTTPSGRVLGADERITAAQALRAFTYGSAFADHQEGRKGSLTRGRLADLVVLSDDPLAVDPASIGSLEVVATIVGGDVAFGEV